jgi:sugar-specific transcriptional regulator TrmB
MVVSELQELGLTLEEAQVYHALLQLGGSYVSAIARKAGVHRVVCYKILDELATKGLVSSFEKSGIKHYSIESPTILVRKEQERLERAEKLLPELLSITNALAFKPKIQYYEGLEGMKNIFDETLTATGEMLGYTNLEAIPKVIPEDFLREYAERKIAKGIKTRMLSPHTPAALRYLTKYYPKSFDPNLVEILFVNPREFHFEYEITIYGDKVAILSLNPQERMGLIIESPVYARTQRAVFQLAWLGATSFVAK